LEALRLVGLTSANLKPLQRRGLAAVTVDPGDKAQPSPDTYLCWQVASGRCADRIVSVQTSGHCREAADTTTARRAAGAP
jgi:hypothetical protein